MCRYNIQLTTLYISRTSIGKNKTLSQLPEWIDHFTGFCWQVDWMWIVLESVGDELISLFPVALPLHLIGTRCSIEWQHGSRTEGAHLYPGYYCNRNGSFWSFLFDNTSAWYRPGQLLPEATSLTLWLQNSGSPAQHQCLIMIEWPAAGIQYITDTVTCYNILLGQGLQSSCNRIMDD